MTTSSIYFDNPDDNKWLERFNTFLAPAWYSIRNWFAVFLITTGTLYASAMFSMQHNIFPPTVAILLAIGIEWTYLSGLAYATETRSDRWSVPMILIGAFTSGLFGVLYVLGRYAVIPAQPSNELSTALAIAHVIPLIILLVVYTFCKRNYLSEQVAIRLEAENRKQAIEDDRIDYERQVRDAKLKLVLAREEIKLQALVVKPLDEKTCDKCGRTLSSYKYAIMKRYGYCMECKGA